jgi:hypothetical protein
MPRHKPEKMKVPNLPLDMPSVTEAVSMLGCRRKGLTQDLPVWVSPDNELTDAHWEVIAPLMPQLVERIVQRSRCESVGRGLSEEQVQILLSSVLINEPQRIFGPIGLPVGADA